MDWGVNKRWGDGEFLFEEKFLWKGEKVFLTKREIRPKNFFFKKNELFGYATQHWEWATVTEDRGLGWLETMRCIWGQFMGSMLSKSGSTEVSLPSFWHQRWQEKPSEEVLFQDKCSKRLWILLLSSEMGLTSDPLGARWSLSLSSDLLTWHLKNLQRFISSSLCVLLTSSGPRISIRSLERTG